MMNLISATDWVLFERDIGIARRILRQVELFMQVLEERMDPDGLLPVGPQGSQIEFGHGGWRYPSSTHVYLLKVCRNMVEVAGMIEGIQDNGDSHAESSIYREKWEAREKRLTQHSGSHRGGTGLWSHHVCLWV